MSAPFDHLELNRDCDCFPITRDQVDRSILSLTDHPDMAAMLAERQNYFAATPVFISPQNTALMQAQITAIEAAIATPAFQNSIYDRSTLAAFAPAKTTQGAFMGYDFHITDQGPKLIEINSNAGGAFIVNALSKAIDRPHGPGEDRIAEMFINEWRLAGRIGQPETIAIIDENPENQFHYPDMCLAADMFRRRGTNVIIADPEALDYKPNGLYVGTEKIDLVYNRLTDFAFELPAHQGLRQAWLDQAVIVTPDPRHHALYADKRNLVTLSDDEKMKDIGLSAQHREVLSRIPNTLIVSDENAESLWEARKRYFFKPFAGFGSRAVYRGDKLTKSKWQDILAGDYVAQDLVRPPVRNVVSANAETPSQKYDVRVYSYAGKPLLMAARIYQGQVTNLRTKGGGLAPVIEVDAPIIACKGLPKSYL